MVCVSNNDRLIGVLLIYQVIPCEVDQAYFLFRRQHGFLAPVVLKDFVQGKAERGVLVNAIVLDGDEGRNPEGRLIVADGLETKEPFPHADGPLLCVGGCAMTPHPTREASTVNATF